MYYLVYLQSLLADLFRQEVIFPGSCDMKPVEQSPKIVYNLKVALLNTYTKMEVA